MRLARCAAAAALALGTVVATAAPAFAEPAGNKPPENDTYAGRTIIRNVPYNKTLDTSQATTDADDAQLNALCGERRTDASVWYQVTAKESGGMVIDVSQSDYSAGAIIATGSPGSWNVLNCWHGAIGWSTVAGQTYTILVHDDQRDGGGNGGTLRLSIDTATPTLPTAEVTLDPVGQVNPPTGTATVTGTLTCTGGTSFAFLDANLRQAVGRLTTIAGFGLIDLDVVCDGASHSWSVEVVPISGEFIGGMATEVTNVAVCGLFGCTVDTEQSTIQLRGGP